MSEELLDRVELDAFRRTVTQEFDATGERLAIIDALVDLARARGLADEHRALALQSACPNCTHCWPDGLTPGPTDPALHGMPMPWLGKEYPQSRVLVLGTNLNNYGGLSSQWWLCNGYGKEQSRGRLGKGAKFFPFGTAVYVDTVLRAIDGENARTGIPSRVEVAHVWDRCGLTEAVKCSPATPRGNPTAEMLQRCPDFLLLDELDILKPRVVVLLGRSTLRDSVRPVLRKHRSLRWGRCPGRLEWDLFDTAGAPTLLFSLNHPSAANRRYWSECVAQLTAELPAALEAQQARFG